MRKSTTKVLSAILVAGMTMSMLAGCGDKAAESTAGEAGGGTADASAAPAGDSHADGFPELDQGCGQRTVRCV